MPLGSPFVEALRDHYVIERELGRGGMARVYLARDLKHDRLIALKVLHSELAATLGPERFLLEIKLAAQLDHPHILSVHDSGEAGGCLWFTMPYVDGETLRDRLRREHQLPIEDAVRITVQTARALDYAHRRGVIHRDIKPENILLNSEGDALVADFGIGRTLSGPGGADHLTETGLLIGTPAYMSPEQASGQRELDGRTDIYSLGAVLFEALAGEPAFTGPSAQAVLAKRFSGQVPRIRLSRPAVPEILDQVLAKAMAPMREDRFETAAQFATALTTNSVPAVASSVAAPARSRKLIVRRSHLAIVGLLLLAALAGLYTWIGGHSAASNDSPKRLVVLPFENLGRPEQEYLAEGVTDEIATQLARVAGLAVISRRTAMSYKQHRKPLKQVGDELGVAYVLAGTVNWDQSDSSGGRVRVTPELIEVRGDRQIWSHSFDVDLTNVFGVQRRIAQEVTRALGGTLRPSANTSATSNLAAYDAYLRGNSAFFQIATTGGNVLTAETAIAAYREAVRLDPALALAWARLAQSIATILAGAPTSPEANARRATEAAQRAVALAPDLAESHLAAAAVSSGAANKRALKRAYALAPNDPQVLHVLARRTREAGPQEYDVLVTGKVDTSGGQWRCKASLELLQHAATLDPKSIPVLRELYFAYSCLDRLDLAEQAVTRALDIEPELVEQWQMKIDLALDAGGLAAARAVLREAKQYVTREALLSYMAMINDKYWVLDELDQQFLLRLGPQAFGNDSLGWALALAHTAALRKDTVTARAYADTAFRVIKARRDPRLAIYEMMALAYLGRRDEAQGVLRLVTAEEPEHPPPGWAYEQLQAIRTYNLLGDRNRAVQIFQRLMARTQQKLPLRLSWRLDPVTAPLSGDPRFEAFFR
jgi:serine/threonine-protein kinase